MSNTIVRSSNETQSSSMLASSMKSACNHLSQMKPENPSQDQNLNLKSLLDSNILEDDVSDYQPAIHKNFQKLIKQSSGDRFNLKVDKMKDSNMSFAESVISCNQAKLERISSFKLGMKRNLDRNISQSSLLFLNTKQQSSQPKKSNSEIDKEFKVPEDQSFHIPLPINKFQKRYSGLSYTSDQSYKDQSKTQYTSPFRQLNGKPFSSNKLPQFSLLNKCDSKPPSFQLNIKPVIQVNVMAQPQPILNKRQQKAEVKQQLKFLEVPEQIESDDVNSSLNSQNQEQFGHQPYLRRGRKRERDDVYFIKGQNKIAEAQQKLKTQGNRLTMKQKQQLRNQISAQKSRLLKKEEAMFLNTEVREKDKKYLDIMRSLLGIINEEQGRQLQDELAKQWNVQEESSLFSFMHQNFVTKQSKLDQFQQNEEKQYFDHE